MSQERAMRVGVATVALLLYGLICVNDFDTKLMQFRGPQIVKFVFFCVMLGILVVPVALKSMIERAFLMAVLGAVIAATGVGVIVLFFMFLWHLANLANRIDKFFSRLPFFFTSSVAYLGAWRIPPILWRHQQTWHMPIWESSLLVGLGGIVLVLLMAGACRIFGMDISTAVLETFVWGWYAVFFFVLLFTGDDGGDEGADW